MTPSATIQKTEDGSWLWEVEADDADYSGSCATYAEAEAEAGTLIAELAAEAAEAAPEPAQAAHRRAIGLALALVRAAYQRAREQERRSHHNPSAASDALDALEREIEALTEQTE